MISSNSEKSSDSRYKTIIILLVVLAALTNASKDLKEFEQLAGSLQTFTEEWLSEGLMTVSARTLSETCTSEVNQGATASNEFRWKGHVAPGGTIEVKGINGDIRAEAANGDEVEVVAKKKGRHSDPETVRIAVVEHSEGVTICAIYPTDHARSNTCEPGEDGQMNVRNNDVQVDFVVRMPSGLGFTGRTVNGEIAASSLGGNVSSRTVNGSITISTSGYADAKTVNGEISARMGDTNWTGPLQFESVNGAINLDLPATISTEVQADTFNGEISTDFPITVLGSFSRKHLEGTIGGGGRQLILKTLNGSISLRKAS